MVVVGGCLEEGWWGCSGSALGWPSMGLCLWLICWIGTHCFETVNFSYLHEQGTGGCLCMFSIPTSPKYRAIKMEKQTKKYFDCFDPYLKNHSAY